MKGLLYWQIPRKRVCSFLCMAKEGRQIFVMGHPEYDRMTLDAEYKRDLGKELAIEMPVNYYPADDLGPEAGTDLEIPCK